MVTVRLSEALPDFVMDAGVKRHYVIPEYLSMEIYSFLFANINLICLFPSQLAVFPLNAQLIKYYIRPWSMKYQFKRR